MPDVFNARMSEQAQIKEDRVAKETEPARPSGSEEPSFNPDHPHRDVEEYSEVMRNEEPSTNPFNSYIPKPINIFFSSQHRSEKIILVLRKHPITQIPWLTTLFFLSLLPLIALALGAGSFAPTNFVVAGVILWYLLMTGFAIESFLSWFFHVFIITDERIIDVDFLSLIYKRITSAKIDNIEDVTAVTGGAIRSVFNFGTVKIQTAGARPEIAFEDVPRPSRVTKLLNELILEEEREKMEGRVN